MRLELDDGEVEVLRRVVERRMDELLHQMASSDTLSFKESLKAEESVLDGLFQKLGCVRPERSLARACSIDTDDLDLLGIEDVG
jgi:hypothetical protein